MNRDKKTGLALGILLIGIVAAFFFRNDSESTVEVPQLSNPETVDELIDEIDGPKPYPVDAGRGAEIAGLQEMGAASTQPSDGNPVSFDFTNSSATGVAVDADVWSGSLADSDEPPQPIEVAAGDLDNPQGASPLPSPDPNSAWQGSGARGPAGSASSSSSGDAPRTYTVRSGDTMSSIAVRFLGSSRRYMEIYELNRDQLASPNDLPTGVTLRLPPRTPARTGTPSSLRDGDGLTEPVSTDATLNRRYPRENPRPVADTPIGAPTPPRSAGSAGSAGSAASAPSVEGGPAERTPERESAPESPRKRFVPVRRSPLMPRGALRNGRSAPGGNQTSAIFPAEPPLDRISQVSPEELDSHSLDE